MLLPFITQLRKTSLILTLLPVLIGAVEYKGPLPPSESTKVVYKVALETLPFDNKEDEADVSRGFIAPLPDNGVIKNKEDKVIWNVSAYDFLDSKQSNNSIHPSLWRQALLLRKAGLFKVTEKIYQIRSADLANMTIIEGQDGIIVIDPLTTVETAKAALDLYYANRLKKPIKALIYTHSHGDHFGGVKGVISQQEVDEKLVKVIAPKGFMEAVLDENVITGNVMERRAGYMFGDLLTPGNQGSSTAGLGLTLPHGTLTLIPPTDLVNKTGQEMIIDGIKFVFVYAPDSEAPAEMIFYLPELKALGIAEDANHTMHNLYTLRGAKTRDAKAWSRYLNEVIALFGSEVEVIFGQHHWPMWGKTKINQFLEKQADLYKYLHDQTLRFANQGYNMVDVAERVKLPEQLSKEWYNRGYYGSTNHNAKAVYNFYLGWFDGNPSNLNPLPTVEASIKYVEYMGGFEAILEKAQKDYDAGNYRFVAEVLNHVVFAQPNNQVAKNLLANTLEQLGYQSENGTWRNFYLTGASELRFGIQKNKNLVVNSNEVISAMSTATFLDYLAVKLNGLKAADHPMIINFNLPDIGEKFILQLRNGVLYHTLGQNSPDAAATFTLNRLDFDRLIVQTVTLSELIENDKLKIEGNVEAFKLFFSLFDTFSFWFNIVEPVDAALVK